MAEAKRALALDRQNQRTHGLQANRAFVIESLLLLLFLAFGLALILRVFAAADASGRAAHAKSTALFLASNAAEVFASNPLQEPATQYFDIDGKEVDQQSAEASFEVAVETTPRSTDAGTFYDATVTVLPLKPSAGDEPYALQTARYVSNARLAALEAYAEMQANGLALEPGQNAVSQEELDAEQNGTAQDQSGLPDQDALQASSEGNAEGASDDGAIEEEILEGPGA